ncbi:hypothetical protein [Catalinimonas niigatensis]|uniref:hypothetical protein n=1 Tax=Catalinimonas niigatensis TaxID=1397264 RepID=UPI002665D46A|nr:hypothetical protein [Catalinimonas niigatensis]WPP49485.1 hypothetical protein PZB72_22705 [Catalinimonas niigatensis]
MKSTTKPGGLFLIVFVSILSISCKEEDFESDSSLENTTWRLTKESWYFSNGDSLIFDNSVEGAGHFIWDFNSDTTLMIHYEPYTFSQDAYWEKNRGTLTIKTKSTNDSFQSKHYTILQLSRSSMILNVEEVNGESNDKGKATKMLYELKKQ